MCGRFTLKTPAPVLLGLFDLPDAAALPPRYNIAPTQPVVVVRNAPAHPGRELVQMRWGLIPSWADDPAIGNRLINARSETAANKPAFRSAFRQRRCLVPADGFYEWQKVGRKKQPFYFHLRDGGPFAFAGLWEHWQKDADQAIESCTLLTTDANDLVRPLHDRMPVILAPEDYERWLDPGTAIPQLEALLRPYPGDAMTAYPVSVQVNNPRNEGPACVERVA